METASSVELHINPWHSRISLSLETLLLVLVIQANIGGCCGSKVDLLVYLSSDLAKGQNSLEKMKMCQVLRYVLIYPSTKEWKTL